MAYGLVPLINGKSYEWADIVINILGVPFAGVTKITYEDSQEMKNVMGAGNRPVSRVYGQFTPSASVTLLMEELENIQRIAPRGVIQNIPEFPIVITYVDAALIPVRHVLKNCRFMKNSRDVSRGSEEIEIELQLIISHIEFV